MNSLPPTCHRRSEYLNASGGRCAKWFAACFDGGLFSSIRRDCMITASNLCNRLPHSAIKMKHRSRCFTAKTSTCRTSESSARGRVSSPRTQQSRSHVVGRDDVRPQPKWENSFGTWNPKTRRAVERGNFVFVETPPHLLTTSRRDSPLQGLEAPSFDFSNNSVDDNCTSRQDMVQAVRDYTSSLDFDVNDPAELLTV